MIKKILINFVVIGESRNLKLDGIKQHVSNLNQGESYWMNLPTTTHSTNDSYLAKEEDFKEALGFLASDLSSYVTKQSLNVDGGWSAW
jgi:NAD(P)-dependent dehydrogenase (short-subunit alcohol dehydrogenase family)